MRRHVGQFRALLLTGRLLVGRVDIHDGLSSQPGILVGKSRGNKWQHCCCDTSRSNNKIGLSCCCSVS